MGGKQGVRRFEEFGGKAEEASYPSGVVCCRGCLQIFQRINLNDSFEVPLLLPSGSAPSASDA